MLQLTNLTPFQAERALLCDPVGNHVWVVVVKGTFHWKEDGTTDLAAAQEPVCLEPRWVGKPGGSSLLREAELVYAHPGTDVTLNATAYAPEEEPVESLVAEVRVGPLEKRVRVVGDRRWKRGPLRTSPGRAEPFTSLPIRYERAFGGNSPGGEEHDTRNPIGCGFALDPFALHELPVPNLEHPDDPITVGGRPAQPVGFGPIPPDWSPRRERAGTFDDAWRRDRLPRWPVDFDPRFFQSAADGLASDAALRGGEEVDLVHLTPSSRMRFRLPRQRLTVDTRIAGRRIRHAVQLDRVILEPDDARVILVWRAALACGVDGRRIERSVVDLKPRRNLG